MLVMLFLCVRSPAGVCGREVEGTSDPVAVVSMTSDMVSGDTTSPAPELEVYC